MNKLEKQYDEKFVSESSLFAVEARYRNEIPTVVGDLLRRTAIYIEEANRQHYILTSKLNEYKRLMQSLSFLMQETEEER